MEEVSLEIARGSYVSLIGASGSGKTTTLKSINRLVEIDAGEVRVAGRAVSDTPLPELRRAIGYVFQGIGLFPHLTVAENIGIAPSLVGWDRARIAARVLALLDLVELPRTYATRQPDALSGGERQRVGVARALATEPSIVLMDEPFGALDPVTRESLGGAYRALHERLGLTTVMVTHDVQEGLILSDRIIVLREGRVVGDGTPAALLSQTSDEGVAALMSTPRRQAERLSALMGAGGEFPSPLKGKG